MCYAQSFASGDDKILDVEVSPADVVAVPTDYNGTKMRVCRFKVVAESQGIIIKPLVESSFTTDAIEEFNEWAKDNCIDCGAEDQYGNYCSECGEAL
jgi:hypothetical protein